jgi:hypothetical protein
VQRQKIAAQRIHRHTGTHSHNEILSGCNRVPAIDLLSCWLVYILLIFFFSSFKRKKYEPPSSLLISFSPSKNTEIIERRLQQIDWKCGKKNRGKGRMGVEKVVQHGN